MIAAPLLALAREELVDGVVGQDRATRVLGALLLVARSAPAKRLMTWASLNVRMRLRENTQLYLDARLMALTAGIPGLEHHERPDYLDKVELLRDEREYLANPFNPISWSVASDRPDGRRRSPCWRRCTRCWCCCRCSALPGLLATFRAEQADVRPAGAAGRAAADAPAPAGAGHPVRRRPRRSASSASAGELLDRRRQLSAALDRAQAGTRPELNNARSPRWDGCVFAAGLRRGGGLRGDPCCAGRAGDAWARWCWCSAWGPRSTSS